jgi:3-oxoacyl-[acyl-carrier protein] reductase
VHASGIELTRLLDRKGVLVTGGSRGIGAGVVRAAMQEGAQVAFIYHRNAEAANDLAQEMERLHPGQRCRPFQCDVADANAMRDTIKAATAELGRVDSLVNNAGITRDAALARMRREQWDEVIATNLGSMFNATQPLVLQFVKQRAGSIINMTSFAGVHGAGAQTNYAASKAGIIGFTKALSKEVASFGVRVNAVAPGFIATDMLAMLDEERMKYIKAQIPAGRLGSCEDVAHLVCFLASDRASYITGQVIQVDGGLVL